MIDWNKAPEWAEWCATDGDNVRWCLRKSQYGRVMSGLQNCHRLKKRLAITNVMHQYRKKYIAILHPLPN